MAAEDTGEPEQAAPGAASRRRVLGAALVLGSAATAAAAASRIGAGTSQSPAPAATTPGPVGPAGSPARADAFVRPAGISLARELPLSGQVVVIDPGHNPHNSQHIAEIDKLVQAGGFLKPCDTVGAETDAGYPEYDFTLDVARRARTILRARGAKVILTQNGHTRYGPCVNVRAAIGNRAHAHAAVSIHADGGPPGGYGFAVLVPEPVHNAFADNRAIIKPSRRLAAAMVKHFEHDTGQNRSTYLGTNGIQPRNDLAGLNLSKVPKVFIECANMRNARDARKVTSARWRQRAAMGIADSISAFLAGH